MAEQAATPSAPVKEAPKFKAPKKRRKWLRRLLTAVVIVAVIAFVLSRMAGKRGGVAVGGYLTAQAEQHNMTVSVTGPGTIKPNDSYQATTLVRGEILSAPFEEGQTVHKDDVLFTLDAADVESAIEQAEIAVEQAKDGVIRAQAGVDQADAGITQANASVQQADAGIAQADTSIQQADAGIQQANDNIARAQVGVTQAEAGVEQAELAVRSAQLTYDNLVRDRGDNAIDRQVKANATGVINKVYVDPGDNVAAGTPIADILDREKMKLTVPFHSVNAKDFYVGQSATVTVSGTAEELTGSISELAAVDTAGPGGALVRNVTIVVDNPGALSSASTAAAKVGQVSSAGSGSFAYNASEQLVALYSGKLERLDIQEGSRVTDGQVVGMFEEKSFQDQLDAAAISLQNAKVGLETANASVESAKLSLSDANTAAANAEIVKRNALLARDNAVVAKQSALAGLENAKTAKQTALVSLQDAKLSQENAENTLQNAKDNLDDYTITSPIDGTVIEKNYKEGDNIDPSSASTSNAFMAVIYDMSRLTFDINVDELDAVKVQVGQKVTITADALDGQSFTGIVDKVNINGVTVNGKTTYPVTVLVDGIGEELAASGLWPGMNVSANIIVEEAGSVLAVPVDAVTRGNLVQVAGDGALDEQGNLIDPTKLIDREVTLGRNDEEYIEILSGLTEGETVYIKNNASSIMSAMMGG